MSGGARRFQAPPGTQDWLPERAGLRRHVVETAIALFERAGYRELTVPTFEDVQLFARTAGESSDVVRKEMYDFVDRGERHLCLRPEFTAGVLRAYLEHGMSRWPQPVRLWSAGMVFRFDRPQKARYREFMQFNPECIGSADPAADAELIALHYRWLELLGLGAVELELNSIGDTADRPAYVARLVEFLDRHLDDLAEDVRQRRTTNPLRAFDTKDERSQRILAEAPKISDHLSPAAREHFEAVRAYLDARGVPYRLEPTLVRGLDYYCRTTWEFKWPSLAAQSTIGAGGRYDGFSELIGGDPAPGVGFGGGVDRVVLALEEAGLAGEAAARPVDLAIVVAVAAARPALHALADDLRLAGLSVDVDVMGRSRKAQLKHVDRLAPRAVLICDEEGWARGVLTLRRGGEALEVAPAAVAAALGAAPA